MFFFITPRDAVDLTATNIEAIVSEHDPSRLPCVVLRLMATPQLISCSLAVNLVDLFVASPDAVKIARHREWHSGDVPNGDDNIPIAASADDILSIDDTPDTIPPSDPPNPCREFLY